LKILLLGCQTVSLGVQLPTFRRYHIRSAHRELYTDRQSVTSYKTWIFSNTVERTSNLSSSRVLRNSGNSEPDCTASCPREQSCS